MCFESTREWGDARDKTSGGIEDKRRVVVWVDEESGYDGIVRVEDVDRWWWWWR